MKLIASLIVSLTMISLPKAEATSIYALPEYVPSYTNIYDIPNPVWAAVGALLAGPQLVLCNTVLFCGHPYELHKKAHREIRRMQKTGVASEFLKTFIHGYRQVIKTSITPHIRPSDAEVDALTDAQMIDIIEFAFQVQRYLNGWYGPSEKLVKILFPEGYKGESADVVLNCIATVTVHGVGYTPALDSDLKFYFEPAPVVEFRGPKQ